MSTEKTFKGRISNKHGTEEYWILSVYTDTTKVELRSNPFIPLAGELIIYDPDSICAYHRMKYGDGVTNVVDLPFASGQADWEQTDENHIGYIQNRPFYDIVTEEEVHIEHDGDNTDKVVFTFSGYDFARMADTTVANISDILEASVVGVADGTTMEVQVTSDMWVDMTSNIGKQNFVAVYSNIPFIVFLNEDIDDTYTAGLYVISMSSMYVTSFTCVIQQVTTKKLDPKYLSFDRTTIIADEEVLLDWNDDFGPTGYFANPFYLELGQTYTIELDGVIYTSVAKYLEDGTGLYLGNGGPFGEEVTEDPYLIVCGGGYSVLIGPWVSSANVKIYIDEYVKIPEKCLPKYETFIATYGVTTYQEIVDAVNAGRIVQAKNSENIVHNFVYNSDEACTFAMSRGTASSVLQVSSSGQWSQSIIGLVGESDIGTAINTALAQAKESGEFQGEQGEQGERGEPGPQGEPGSNGMDGYTPVRGTDYWTDEDKAEIKAYVDDAILNGAW